MEMVLSGPVVKEGLFFFHVVSFSFFSFFSSFQFTRILSAIAKDDLLLGIPSQAYRYLEDLSPVGSLADEACEDRRQEPRQPPAASRL
jgi:hypothetical protein